MRFPTNKAVLKFLRASNAIEGVYDEESLEQAQIAWNFLMRQEAMSLGVILRTHKILMLNQHNLRPHERGYFREVPVYIGGEAALNPLHIREHLEPWVEAMNAKIAHPKLSWKQLHVDYERIHPFVDGNGRTGRMFMNWYRVRNGLPLYIVREGDEQQRYYKWFE